MTRRLVSVLLTLVLLVSCFSFVFTASAAKAEGELKISGSKVVAVGKKITLSASMPITKWKSSDKKIATVSEDGVVKGKKPGKVKITAKAEDGSKKTWKITVYEDKVKSVKISAPTKTLDLNGTKSVKLKAEASPDDAAQEFTWKSSDPSVAKVSSSGKVTAVSVGKAKITATAQDGSKKSKSITIKVKDSKKEETPEKPEEPESPETGDSITCAFTLPKEKAQIGKPYTFAYKLKGGSGSYSDVHATFEFVTESDYGGHQIDYQRIDHTGSPSGTVTVTPKAGTAAIVRIIGKDAETGEGFNCELNTGWLPIEPNENYKVSFKYDSDQYTVGDTISADYSITGLSELRNGKIWWLVAGNMTMDAYQNEKSISSPTGTHSYKPTYGRCVYVVIEGEDQNGVPIYAEGRHLKIKSYDPITCAFTLPKGKAQIGKPYTFAYKLSGGSGSYSDVHATFEFVTVCDYAGHQIDYQRIDDTGSPSGTVTVTPKVGTAAIVRIIGKDAETGEGFNCELDTGWLPIEANKKYKVTFKYDSDQYTIGDTINVDYSITGLGELRNGKIWWLLSSNMTMGAYQNEKSISSVTGTHLYKPTYGRYVYVVIEGEDQNGVPIYAEGGRLTLKQKQSKK